MIVRLGHRITIVQTILQYMDENDQVVKEETLTGESRSLDPMALANIGAEFHAVWQKGRADLAGLVEKQTAEKQPDPPAYPSDTPSEPDRPGSEEAS